MAKVNVGDRFDKLVVIKREDIPRKTRKRYPNGDVYYELSDKKNIAWVCKCDCGETTDPIIQSTLIKEKSVLRSCGKCTPERNPNYIPPNISREENDDWNELYEYVRTNILGYDKGMSLNSGQVTRLKGLTTGNYRINKRIAQNAKYSHKTVLNTFKFCSPNIHRALRTMTFKDENYKFNYICKIVENNINNVYLRMQNAEKAKEQAKNMTIETATHTGAEYQRKTEEKTNKLFDDLW